MNWNILLKDDANILLLVAHADDEIIFCGGTMLLYPNYKWTVVVMAEGGGKEEEFKGAMNSFKSLGINIDMEFSRWLGHKNVNQKAKVSKLVEERKIWGEALKKLELSPDIVITHNEIGEYGHAAHKLLNRVADDTFSKNVWKFIYPKEGQPYGEKINKIRLSNEILNKKKKIFYDNYKSQHDNLNTLHNLRDYAFEEGPEIFTSD